MIDASDLAVTLCWAASEGDLLEIKRLVAGGYDLNEPDYDGRTALHLACANGHLDVVHYLVNKNVKLAPIDRMGDAPLDDAKRSEHQEIVGYLEEALASSSGDLGSSSDAEAATSTAFIKKASAELLFESLDDDADGKVTKHDLFLALKQNGVQLDDPRLKETVTALAGHQDLQRITLEEFTEITNFNLTLIEKALTGQLSVPEFQAFCDDIIQIHDAAKPNEGGANANYIPQLDKVNPEYFGVSICTVDGQRFQHGDTGVPYSVQSTCKPINYCLALTERGEDKVHEHIGREPSGHGFNELALNSRDRPHNPMINAGAIMACSLIQPGLTADERFEYVLNQWRFLSGVQNPLEIGFDNAVCLSESRTSDRNRALGYFMKEKGAFPEGTDLEDILSFYFQCCSIQITCASQATVASTLANSGICPMTGKKLFEPDTTKHCLSLMYSCGMYDYSGEFAFKVGLPAKSGVSGNVMLVMPGVMGICIWSPRLDELGNSVRGIEFCKRLVEVYSFHNFDHLLTRSAKKDPCKRKYADRIESINKLCSAAANGDLNEIKRLQANGASLDGADYDGRTPMHLAASEGRSHVVKYLIDQGVFIGPNDRWGNTPLTDARRIDNAGIIALLEQRMPHSPLMPHAVFASLLPGGVESSVSRRPKHLFLPVRDRSQDAQRPASI
jgi:glutaminase